MIDRRSSHVLAFVMLLAAQGIPGVAWLLMPPLSRTARMTMAAQGVTATKKVAIAGGGPAGSLMAIYLARNPSFEVDVFESSSLDAMAGASNRSYNVVMMDRAFDALREGGVDLVEEVRLCRHVAGSVSCHPQRVGRSIMSDLEWGIRVYPVGPVSKILECVVWDPKLGQKDIPSPSPAFNCTSRNIPGRARAGHNKYDGLPKQCEMKRHVCCHCHDAAAWTKLETISLDGLSALIALSVSRTLPPGRRAGS